MYTIGSTDNTVGMPNAKPQTWTDQGISSTIVYSVAYKLWISGGTFMGGRAMSSPFLP